MPVKPEWWLDREKRPAHRKPADIFAAPTSYKGNGDRQIPVLVSFEMDPFRNASHSREGGNPVRRNGPPLSRG